MRTVALITTTLSVIAFIVCATAWVAIVVKSMLRTGNWILHRQILSADKVAMYLMQED